MPTNHAELAALRDEPLRFSVKQEDFQRAFDVARLAGEYARITLLVESGALTLRTEGDGITCVAHCKIGNVRGPSLALAVTMIRAPLEELAAKKSHWGVLECKISAVETPDDKTGSWSTIWHFEYGQTFAMCSAEPIDMPEALSDVSDAKEFNSAHVAQTLRWLRPFTDSERKKTQFTAACIRETGGHAVTPSAARSIGELVGSEQEFHVGSGHINDLAHALARFEKPALISQNDESVVLRDARSVCKLRRARLSASFPLLKLDGSEPAITLSSGELEDALTRVGSQAKRNTAPVRIQAGPSVGSFVILSTEVDGGTARYRLAIQDAAVAADIDVLVPVVSLTKMIAPSGGADADLTFLHGAVLCRQYPGDVAIRTLLLATAAPVSSKGR